MTTLTGSGLLALAVARLAWGRMAGRAYWWGFPSRALGRGCGGDGARPAGASSRRRRSYGRSRDALWHLDFASQSQARSTQNSQENMVFAVNNTWQK